MSLRLNCGSGAYPLDGYINIDADPKAPAQRHETVPPLPYASGAVSEVFAGHFLEHLDRPTAERFLAECSRVLRPGGRLGVVVPDTREIMRRYLRGGAEVFEVPYGHVRRVCDLDEICDVFIYSTCQDTPHRWMYDEDTLRRAIEQAGFTDIRPIDPNDPRIGVPTWWNLGLEAVRP